MLYRSVKENVTLFPTIKATQTNTVALHDIKTSLAGRWFIPWSLRFISFLHGFDFPSIVLYLYIMKLMAFCLGLPVFWKSWCGGLSSRLAYKSQWDLLPTNFSLSKTISQVIMKETHLGRGIKNKWISSQHLANGFPIKQWGFPLVSHPVEPHIYWTWMNLSKYSSFTGYRKKSINCFEEMVDWHFAITGNWGLKSCASPQTFWVVGRENILSLFFHKRKEGKKEGVSLKHWLNGSWFLLLDKIILWQYLNELKINFWEVKGRSIKLI